MSKIGDVYNQVAFQEYPMERPNEEEVVKKLITWVVNNPEFFNESINKKCTKLVNIDMRLILLDTKLKAAKGANIFTTVKNLTHVNQINAQIAELGNYKKALQQTFKKEVYEFAAKENPNGRYNNEKNALYCEIQALLGKAEPRGILLI